MQSLNGVYINGKTKIKPSTPVALEVGTEICFGTLIPQNELKYTFLKLSNGSHVLLRVGAKPLMVDGGDPASVSHDTSDNKEVALDRESTPLSSERDVTPPSTTSDSSMQHNLTPPSQHTATPPANITPPLPTPTTVCHSLTPPLPTPATVCHSLTPSLPSPNTLCHNDPPPLTDSPDTVDHTDNPSLEMQEPEAKKARLEVDDSTDQAVVCSSHSQIDSNAHTNEQKQCADEATPAPLNEGGESQTNSEASRPPLTLRTDPGTLASSSNTDKTVESIPQPSCSASNARRRSTTPISVTPASQHKPTPGLSSTTIIIDELFSDGAMDKCFDEIVSEAMFGEEPLPSQSSMPASGGDQGDGSRGHVDGTSIQIQAVKDEMEKEKLKLLSNIEALKSELASKERLLGEKLEIEKAVEESKKQSAGVIDSMQEELTCIICQELFVVAHTLTCSHSFCRSCINEWMKSKKECPICRKPISTKPVRSLVLDNAIDKMVEKMSKEAREERKKLKESRTASAASGTGSVVVDMLATARALGVLTPNPTTASSSGGARGGRNRGGSGGGRNSSVSGGARGSSGPRTTGDGSANAPIVVPSNTPPRHRRRHDYEEEEDESDYDDYDDYDDYSDSDEESDPGLPGHYYRGYGRCYNCGKTKDIVSSAFLLSLSVL